MTNQFGIQGFYKTPVCKTLMLIIGIPSCILNFNTQWRPYFVYSFADLTNPYKFWKVFSSKFVFIDTTDLVCGLVLLYCFRIFERRAGSRKFSSYILAMFILCTGFEMMCLIMFNLAGIDKITWQPGFHSILMSLFVKFYLDIPRTETSSILGLPFSSKTITYFMGLQIVISEPMDALFRLCGILMGVLYRYNIINVQQWFNIPQSVAAFISRTLGPILRTKPPQRLLQPMGATREIQRRQRMELIEQQMLITQAQRFINLQDRPFSRRQHAIRRRNTNNLENQVQAGEDRSQTEETGQINRGDRMQVEQQPPEEKIIQLTDMGFSRSEVLHALSATNNDVSMATNLLLHE